MKSIERLKEGFETLEGEGLKSAAEFALHSLSKYQTGLKAIDAISGGARIEDPRLASEVAGISFENPLMVGAGWDKKGKAADGLYALGFAGVEVGTVTALPQYGNPKPRLWTDSSKSVGLNSLGFNSKGRMYVADQLSRQERKGVIGISLGKNKLMPERCAPWAHVVVAESLYSFADYLVLNVSSPNTPGLRDQLQKEPLTDNIKAINEYRFSRGSIPLFVKFTVDMAIEDLDAALEVCINEKVDGVIDTNTTTDNSLKSRYGWENKPGGLSGNDYFYRTKAKHRMRHITKETAGTGLQRIGVGGINSTETALDRIKSGAQVVQVVTAIRQNKGHVARDILAGMLEQMDKDGVKNITEYIGVDVI